MFNNDIWYIICEYSKEKERKSICLTEKSAHDSYKTINQICLSNGRLKHIINKNLPLDLNKLSKDKLIKTTVFQNPWSKEVLKGVRAPGTGIPYVILLGTMRYKGGKDFTAIYKRSPVTVYEFKEYSFKRWIVTQ